jgi:hypothetical protein
MRTIQIDYDTSIQPGFGYHYAFQKPTDWVLTSALCVDEFFTTPLTRYVDETGFWYADLTTVFVRYVSNDANYGGDMSKWTESFREYVEAHFASKIILKLSNSDEELKRIEDKTKELRLKAKSNSAMADPTSFPARGNWSNSRTRFPNRRDGGNRNGNLIG